MEDKAAAAANAAKAPAQPTFTHEQILAKARELFPRKSNAWVGKLVALLIQFGPAIIAAFMGKTVDPVVAQHGSIAVHDARQVDQSLAILAALVDLHQPQGFKGPVVDPFLHTMAEKMREFIKQNEDRVMDAAEAFAINWVSPYLP
jgi:hypothetical protein